MRYSGDEKQNHFELQDSKIAAKQLTVFVKVSALVDPLFSNSNTLV
jgi:hypothetical protein